MKKHFRPLIATLCVCALLFAGFILAVNLYVQSKAVQSRIRATLSSALGMPVSVFRATFSPWGGFRLDEVRVPSNGTGPDFLKANCLEVRCEFIPLLQGRVVLKRIALEAPHFVFQKNPAGFYQLPEPQSKRPAPIPGVPEPVAPEKTPAPALPESNLAIRKLLLRDGNFRFLDRDGRELVRFEMVRCSLSAKDATQTFAGDLEIKKIVLLERWEATDLQADVSLDRQKIHIDKFRGDMAGGRVEGELTGDGATTNRPYNLWVRLSKGDLGKFFPPDSDLAGELVGLVHARLDYTGTLGDAMTNSGKAEFKISRAKITQIPVLQILSQILRSDEFSSFAIKRVGIKANIAGPQIQIQPSTIEADHAKVTFSGPLDADRKLQLQAQLHLDDDLFKKLPSEVRENFVADPVAQEKMLAFTITGPLDSPKTNLLNRLIGEKLQKKFRRFLGSGEKPEKMPKPSPKK